MKKWILFSLLLVPFRANSSLNPHALNSKSFVIFTAGTLIGVAITHYVLSKKNFERIRELNRVHLDQLTQVSQSHEADIAGHKRTSDEELNTLGELVVALQAEAQSERQTKEAAEEMIKGLLAQLQRRR